MLTLISYIYIQSTADKMTSQGQVCHYGLTLVMLLYMEYM